MAYQIYGFVVVGVGGGGYARRLPDNPVVNSRQGGVPVPAILPERATGKAKIQGTLGAP
ncbi:MAG: hypothetical protein QGG67_07705 [Gammaproteobacteria bacterium]|nr:hypothetical protein [Gammaproteobacteria bacterium]